jgi:hypothetical protein
MIIDENRKECQAVAAAGRLAFCDSRKNGNVGEKQRWGWSIISHLSGLLVNSHSSLSVGKLRALSPQLSLSVGP